MMQCVCVAAVLGIVPPISVLACRGNGGCCANHYEVKGLCIECPAGTFGYNCTAVCIDGYYGRFCKEVCKCSSNEVCDRRSGCMKVNEYVTDVIALAGEEQGGPNWIQIASLVALGSLLTVAIIALIVSVKKCKCRKSRSPGTLEEFISFLSMNSRSNNSQSAGPHVVFHAQQAGGRTNTGESSSNVYSTLSRTSLYNTLSFSKRNCSGQELYQSLDANTRNDHGSSSKDCSSKDGSPLALYAGHTNVFASPNIVQSTNELGETSYRGDSNGESMKPELPSRPVKKKKVVQQHERTTLSKHREELTLDIPESSRAFKSPKE